MTKPKTPQIRFSGFTDEWEEKELGEISEPLQYGLNAAATDYDGVNKYIRITDIDDETNSLKLDDLTSPKVDLVLSKNFILKKGDILFARTGASVGKTYRYRESDGLIYYAGFLIRAHIVSNYDSEFVFQNTLSAQYFKFIKITSQRSGQPGVNAQEYSSWILNLPKENTEQTQIGNYFQKLDDLIAKTRNKLDKLKNMKQACLSKMFPQRGATTPQIRFSGFSDEWEEKKFSELYQRINEKNDLRYDTDKIISVANMYFKSDIYISNKEYLKTYNIFKLGDIAFEGNKSKSFTHGRFVENSIGDGIVSHVFDVFRPITKYNLNFWKYAINNDLLMKNILIRSTKSSTMMTNLVADDFLKESFLVPEIKEQTQIGNFFKNFDNLIALNEKQLGKLQNIKASCLDKMFVNNG